MKRSIKRLALYLQPILFVTLVTSSDTLLRGRDPSSTERTTSPQAYNTTRKLLDGTEACSNCPEETHQCIGRSVSDEVCGPCAAGETFWPCNVEKECWCWDMSGPKDPGDEDGPSVCNGCSGPTESCIANANSLIPADDEGCAGCATGQKYWPCDVDGLCWCWDSTKPKKPPAPSSGLEITTSGKSACDIFTEEMYNEFAPNNTFPYTYEGFCEAIEDYNLYHEEKVFMMGTEDDQRNEIAAFLGNTAHESDDYEAGREYLACADNVEVDGKVYCKPCTNDLFDWETMKCTQSMADLDSPYSEYCQPVFVPPEGCNCETITQVASEGDLAGYIDASKVFYGRGAIQLSWNYNYIKASLALTGEPETFCENPELVVSDPKYAWGSAIYFWMESEKEGDTCHKEALKHNFGGTLNVINGGLECPAYAGGWHHKAVKMRINRYCHASLLLHLDEIGSMKGCKGMDDSLEECLHDGTCPYCVQMNGGEYIYVNEGSGVLEERVVDDEILGMETLANETDSNTTIMPSVNIEATASNNPTPASVTNISTSQPTVAGTAGASTTSTLGASTTSTLEASATSTSEASATSTLETSTSGLTSPSPAASLAPSLSSGINDASPSLSSQSLPPNSTSTSSSPTIMTSTQPNNTSTSSSPTGMASTQHTNATLELYNVTVAPSPSIAVGNATIESHNETAAPSPVLSSNGTAAPISSTANETAAPSPVQNESENTIPTWSPTATATDPPSFSPTTPAPTQGPCDGDPCPDQLCRSPWGFCGEGEGYCNEEAVWSPDCPSESSAPTPAGTSSGSETSTFDLGDFIGYDPYNPDTNDTDVNATETSEPTKEPTLSQEKPNFVKPSGGKKPPPNKKPSDGKGETVSIESSDTPAPITPMPTELTGTDSPTPLPVLSPDNPAATYFCGADWIDANEVCEIRCPSAKSEDCPGNQSCYAFTRCNDPSPTPSPVTGNATEIVDEDDSEAITSDTSSTPVATNATASNPAASSTSGSSSAGALNDVDCKGQPCELVGECRSQFGFCGGSFIYCNDLSSWSMDKCGLYGTDTNGETILCGAEVQDCPGGERVIRNPAQGCEFFPCPASEEEGDSLGGFVVPGPAPTLPELPKPTLPTIVDPKKPDFNLGLTFGGSKPSNGTIDLGLGSSSKDSGNVVVISDEEDVTNDEDKSSKSTDETIEVKDPFSGIFDSKFNYEEWVAGVGRSGGLRASMTWISYVSLSAAAALLIIY